MVYDMMYKSKYKCHKYAFINDNRLNIMIQNLYSIIY